jgi:hypothetical protein
MDCSYQLPREHKGVREELGITDVTLGPELAIRTKGHSGSRPTARRRSVNASSMSCIVPCPRSSVHRRPDRSQPHDTPGCSQQARFLLTTFGNSISIRPTREASWASSDKQALVDVVGQGTMKVGYPVQFFFERGRALRP